MRSWLFVVMAGLLTSGMMPAEDKKEVVVVTTEELVDIKTGKTTEADARQRLAGKRGVFTLTTRTDWQDVRTGPKAGQTLFTFKDERAGKTMHTLAFYTKDPKTIGALKGRELGERTPFKVRGRIMIDYQSTVRIWLLEAEIVKE